MNVEWFTCGQVAQRLQVSKSTVYRWTREGRLRAYKFGGVVRYRREDVEAMARLVQPTGSGEKEVAE